MSRQPATPDRHRATESQPEDGRGTPTLGAALLLILAAGLLFMVGGAPLQIFLGEVGFLLSQVLFLGLLPVVLVVMRGYDARKTFCLRLPSGIQLVAGLLLLAGGTQIAWFLAWLQSLWIPVPVEYLEALIEVLTADSIPRFLWLLLFVAAVPAVAEELLFRGILLSGFRSRFPALLAVAGTGLVFGVFHLAPQTGFRILPTAWLGMVLAWAVVASGSLPLAMVLHFVNNATLVSLAAWPGTRHLVSGREEAPSLLFLPLALLLLAGGVRLMLRDGGPATAVGEAGAGRSRVDPEPPRFDRTEDGGMP